MNTSTFLKSFGTSQLVLALTLAAASNAGVQSYNYSRVGPEGTRRSLPIDINNAGTIIGLLRPPAQGLTFNFVKTRHGDFVPFTIPGARSAGLNSINSQGTVVGSFTESNDTRHAFIANSDGSGLRVLPLIDGLVPAPSAISANGQVFGNISAFDPDTDETLVQRGVIIDTRHGDAVTYVDYPEPALPYTTLVAGNNRGMLLGSARDADFTEFAYFTATRGHFATVGFPETTFTDVDDINNQGDVVGLCGMGYSDTPNPFPLDPVAPRMFWSFANSRGFLAEKPGD